MKIRFSHILLPNQIEKQSWNTFIVVTKIFHDSNKSAYFHAKLKLILDCYNKIECNMSTKLHFFIHIWAFFLKIWVHLALKMEDTLSKMWLHEDGSLLSSQHTVGAVSEILYPIMRKKPATQKNFFCNQNINVNQIEWFNLWENCDSWLFI